MGAVGQYSHFHRTGRITLPLPELAAYVGRYVVHAVAADEAAALAALRGPAPSPRSADSWGAATRYVADPTRRRPGGAEVAYAFLSDEWLEAAKAIREEYAGKGAPPAHVVRMNQIITEVPFGDGTINAHMDTSSGELDMDIGHLENPDLTVTLDYATAKAILVEGNPQAGMQAFMAGKIKVQGDMTKLMAMQQGTPDPVQAEVAAKIQEITE